MPKITLELDLAEAIELCVFHSAMMEICVKGMGNDPLAYSKAATITNSFQDKVANQALLQHPEDLKNIIAEIRNS